MWFMTACINVGLAAVLHLGHVSGPLIVAHRGASHDAPENTMAAFQLGWEQDADAIEGDFHLTADGQIVCIHDRDAKRVAGVDRNIADMTLAEAQQLDVGLWKGPQFTGQRAPTLSDVLAIVPPGKLFLIEIKCGVEIMPELSRVLTPHAKLFPQLRIISFKADVIAAAKRDLPAIKAYWLTSFKKAADGTITPSVATILETLDTTAADGLDAKADLFELHPALMGALREHGYEAHAWTVDDVAMAQRLARMGIDSITTNRPRVIRDALSQ